MLYRVPLIVLSCASLGWANLTGIPLQQHAVYQPPGPAGNPNQGGTWSYQLNTLNLPLPTWSSDGLTLTVPNSADNTQKKDLWFEVDYRAGFRPAVAPAIDVTAAGVVTPFPPVAGVDDWTYHWLITPQPSFETFELLPTYFLLQGNMIKLEVGTNCTPLPEPAMAITAFAACGLARRKR